MGICSGDSLFLPPPRSLWVGAVQCVRAILTQDSIRYWVCVGIFFILYVCMYVYIYTLNMQKNIRKYRYKIGSRNIG